MVGAGARLRRGVVYSFNSTTWRAQVFVDGSAGVATIDVGDWVNLAALVANAKVAVMLFSDVNPDDGLVVGVYSEVGGWDYFTRTLLASGEELTIPASHEMRLKDAYAVTGTLIVSGLLVVD